MEIAQSQTVAPKYTEPYTPLPTISAPSVTFTPQASITTSPKVVFAAIGDYGSGNQDEADVAKLIDSWQGQFFHGYIYPYIGNYGNGAEVNRFFPSLGNHDWISENGKPYFNYFTLPGNERYYDFTWGSVHLFALDNIDSEPDGVGASSIQAQWLKAGLTGSTSTWNIVYMHYAPYSSGTHGSTDWARWPYAEWGADAVLAGHDHSYERLVENGLVYFVNGLGGAGRYEFLHHEVGSVVRYNSDYGAMRLEATETEIKFDFITRTGEVVDTYELVK
jgi:hypothetical protein